MSELRETPLAGRHRELGAKLVPFAGYEMPVHYDGVLAEHKRVRDTCGIFDVGHMGTVFVRGRDATPFLQSMLTNDVTKAAVGRAQYTVLCNDSGGVIDDLIISHLDEQPGRDDWMIVPNAANIYEVVSALEHSVARWDVAIHDASPSWGIIAVQGPAHEQVLANALPGVSVGRFGVTKFDAGGHSTILSGTGYTGSPGVEIVAPHAAIAEYWDLLLEAAEAAEGGPAGLGARDTLRLEMGYPLHGQDISPEISPLEAGLGWVVKLDGGDFQGADALRAQVAEGVTRTSVGFVMPDRRPARSHCTVLDAAGDAIGEVTSGNYSPGLDRGIGLALVNTGSQPAAIDVRGRTIAIEVVETPFLKP